MGGVSLISDINQSIIVLFSDQKVQQLQIIVPNGINKVGPERPHGHSSVLKHVQPADTSADCTQ